METTNHRRSRAWLDLLLIGASMALGAIALTVFLLPNHITMGGVGGIASILYWGLGIPASLSYLVINLVLLAVAWRILGLGFVLKTIYAVGVFALTSAAIEQCGPVTLLSDQPFMATVVGAFFLGLSSGLGLACNASTGGSDTVAAMINKYHDISLGHIIMLVDVIIITSSYVVLRSWEQVIYGYVLLFIMAMVVDHVVSLMRRSVQFCIITTHPTELSKAINSRADRGCTIFDGHGSYSGRDMQMLIVLARAHESATIFQIIDEIDPQAFVSQTAVIGVYGLGFDKFKVKKKRE